MFYTVVLIIIVSCIAFAWDYKQLGARARFAGEDQDRLVHKYKGLVLFLMSSTVLVAVGAALLSGQVAPVRFSDRLTCLFSGAVGLAFSYANFLTYLDPDRNQLTRFINWYSRPKVRFMRIDVGRQCLAMSLFCLLMSAACVFLAIKGVSLSR
jgi:hypothetical protein